MAGRRRERRRLERLHFQKGEVAAPAVTPAEARLLEPFLSEGRPARLREVLARRTDRLVLVLDRLYDPHNLSAILRTADAFGLQYVWLTGAFPEGLNPQVTMGAHRWLTLRHEPDAARCASGLRAAGYRIATAALAEGAQDPKGYDAPPRLALVLGNEHEGLGRDWLGEADACLRIPLCGFARSLNVSVAAGILLSELLARPCLAQRGLPPAEAEALEALWIWQSLPEADQILAGIKNAARAGTPPDHDVER